MNDKSDNKEIEVIIGDETVLNISEVGDCMNTLRPKDSIKNRKKVIIPISKNSNNNKKKNK